MRIAIDLGGTGFRIASFVDGEIHQRASGQWRENATFEEDMSDLMTSMSRLHQGHSALEQIGVSAAPRIGPDGCVVGWPNRPLWTGHSLGRKLRTAFDVPCLIDDDVNCAALAELKRGYGRALENFMLLNVGTGIGAGIVLNGSVFRGVSGNAGELGHVLVDLDGEMCRCGNRGCLQAMASGPAFAKHLHQSGYPSRAAFENSYNAGELRAHRLLWKFGRVIGFGLASADALLDIEGVVIAGGLSALGETWYRSISFHMKSRQINPHKKFRIVRSALGEDASLFGAAVLNEFQCNYVF